MEFSVNKTVKSTDISAKYWKTRLHIASNVPFFVVFPQRTERIRLFLHVYFENIPKKTLRTLQVCLLILHIFCLIAQKQ